MKVAMCLNCGKYPPVDGELCSNCLQHRLAAGDVVMNKLRDEMILDQITEYRQRTIKKWHETIDLIFELQADTTDEETVAEILNCDLMVEEGFRNKDRTICMMRVGLKYFPDKFREILREIHENDAAINRLTGLLVTRLITDKCLCIEDGTTNSCCPIHGMMA